MSLYVILERRKGDKTWRVTNGGRDWIRGYGSKAEAVRDARWDTPDGYEWAVTTVNLDEFVAEGEVVSDSGGAK